MPDDLQSRLDEFEAPLKQAGGQPDRPNNDLNLEGRLRDFEAPLAQQQRRQQDALDEQYRKVPFDAPPEHRPYYTLEQARERESRRYTTETPAMPADGWTTWTRRQLGLPEEGARREAGADVPSQYAKAALPLGSLLGRSARKNYEAAAERYEANDYGDDYEGQTKREADAAKIANYEHDQQITSRFQRDRPLLSTAASVQGVLHEAAIGGGLTQAAAPGFAAARTGTGLVPRLAIGGAELATRTATMPSLYAQGESKSDTVNFVRGMVLTKILGSLGKQAEPLAGRVPTALGRRTASAAIGAAAFPAEQQVADTATSLMDEVLPDALQFRTKYGTLGAVLRKEEGAERSLALEALTGALFAAMHAPKDSRARKQAFIDDLQRRLNDTGATVIEASPESRLDRSAASAGSAGENATPPTPESALVRSQETPVQSPPATVAERPPVEPPNSPLGQEIVAPERPGEFSDLGKGQRVRDALGDLMGKAKIEAWAEEQQHSLVDLDDAGVTPTAYWNRFFDEVYPRLPEHAQKHIDSQVAGIFNLRPGDVKGVRTDPKTGAKTDVHVNDVKDVDGFGDFGSFEDMIREGGWTKPMRGLALKMATLEQLAGAQSTVGAARAALPASPLDRLRAKQQPVESKPQPKRNGLQSLFPEAPVEEPAEPEPGEVGASKYRDNAKLLSPEDLGKTGDEWGRGAAGMGAAGGGGGEGEPPPGTPLAGTGAPGPPVAAKPSSWFTKAGDWIKSFAQQQFPALHRLDRETGESLSRAANADTAAKAGWNYFSNLLKIGKKPMSKWTDAEDRAAGAAWLERRARHERDRLNAAGEDSSGIPTFVGAEGSPLRTEADYQAAQEGMWSFYEQVKQDWTPEADKNFRGLKGLDPSDEINSPTQIPQLPLNMIGLSEADPARGIVRGASRGLAGQQINRPGFTKKTTFTAEAYDLSLRNMMKRTLDLGVPAARRAEFVRQAIDAGLIKDVSKGERKPEGYLYLGLDPAAGLGLDPNAKYYVHPEAFRDVVQGLNIGERPGNVVGDLARRAVGVLYNVALLQPAEIASHVGNHLTALFAEGMGVPGWNLKDSISNALKVWRNDPEAMRKVKNLADIGASFEHEAKPGLLENLGVGKLGETGAKVAKYEPTALLGKFTSGLIDTMQKAVRLQLNDAYDRLSARDGVKFLATEQGKRDFINKQLGSYNSKASNAVMQFLKDTGLQSFATAAATFTRQGANRAFLGLGPLGAKPVSGRAAVELHATQLAKMIPLLALGPVLNKLLWDDWFPDDVPTFAVKTGVKDGRSVYFDPLKPPGVRRGWRALGINSTVEGLRHEQSAGKIAANAADDVIQAGEHLVAGVPAQAVHTMATGRDSMGRQIASKDDLGGRLLAGARGLNPVPDLVMGEDEQGRPTKFGGGPLRFLKPFGLNTSKGPGATALSDAYELKKQYLAKTGRADESAPQASAIAPLRDAALADDIDAFRKAWQAYRDRAKAAGKSADRFNHDLGASLRHLDPLASLADDDKGRFYRSLSVEQKKKVDQARVYAEEVRKKIVRMIPKAGP